MPTISINRLPQSYPFMEMVQTEALHAQGWEKWLPGSDLLGGTNFRESLPIEIKFVPLSHSTFKLRVSLWEYSDKAVTIPSSRLENMLSI